MKIMNIHEAKTHLSQLLECVARGEEVIIARAGKPVARLVPYSSSESKRRRKGGQWKGLVRIGDDFDEPLPDDVADTFRGKGR